LTQTNSKPFNPSTFPHPKTLASNHPSIMPHNVTPQNPFATSFP
jgi:hypothetical protein